MPISVAEREKLSAKLACDREFRQRFLADPVGAAAELAVTLSAADAQALKELAAGILDQGKQLDDGRLQAKVILIITEGGFGPDESGERKWPFSNALNVCSSGALEKRVEELLDQEVLVGKQIAGASVALVRRCGDNWEQIFVSRGTRDAAQASAKIDRDTIFRVGSISKLITATAVMRLAELRDANGIPLLDLDADVNTYLGHLPPHQRIPDNGRYGQVTLRHLLTHTAGFEENQVGLAKKESGKVVQLEKAITDHRPARVRKVPRFIKGECDDCTSASYSSWGFALAGYIVGEVAKRNGLIKNPTGSPFDDYVQQELFGKLMSRTSFAEPATPDWSDNLSRGHVRDEKAGRFVPQDYYEYLGALGPACSLSTTAADMANFMIAHLDGGACNKTPILEQASVDEMHRGQLQPGGIGNRGCLGFYEWRLAGQELLCHQGVTINFNSMLVLMPQANVGIFLAVNTGGLSANARIHWFVRDFIDSFFHIDPDPAVGWGKAEQYAGTYLSNTHSYKTPEKALLLHPNCEIKVKPGSNDLSLEIENMGWKDWVQTGAETFTHQFGKNESGQNNAFGKGDVCAFSKDRQHVVGPMPFNAGYRLKWWQTPTFHRRVLGTAAILFMLELGIAIFPIPPFGGLRAVSGSTSAEIARWLAVAISLLGLSALIGLRSLFFADPLGLRQLAFGFPPPFKRALKLILASVPVTGVFALVVVAAFLLGWWPRPVLLHYGAFLLAMLAFLWSMHYWNLIGRKFAW